MSSKEYKGKTCPYCAVAVSTTEEHVFARTFFREEDRKDLPKAPACLRCNGLKSELEHYALTVLPFGARHHAALSDLHTVVPRRLGKNQKLFRELKAGRGRAWVTAGPDALVVPTMTVPVDQSKIRSLAAFITKGLIWHHWQIYLDVKDTISSTFLTAAGDSMLRHHLTGSNVRSVNVELGLGTIRYQGFQHPEIPKATIWRISMLGGVQFASGDPEDGTCSTVTAVTRPHPTPVPGWPRWASEGASGLSEE